MERAVLPREEEQLRLAEVQLEVVIRHPHTNSHNNYNLKLITWEY
jgi:hypothetical protein